MYLAAYFTFLANLAFGVLVKSGVIDTTRFRFIHHALYFVVMASIVIGAILAIGTAPLRAGLLGGMTLLLLLMPRFRGRSRAHWMYATFCAALYSAIVLFS